MGLQDAIEMVLVAKHFKKKSKGLRCCYTAQFFRQLVSQRRCNESCRKNHSTVTLCNFLQQLAKCLPFFVFWFLA